ncbi:hypothetical protein [Halomicrobium salinisoli]|uniref:hypothetical protein n=1 Tax=Halomicrobium salinisoli TaxID=2878391 RepID=UPI001CF06A9F|nr:hypothetical protein [Halomicrobium salinisoli]
MDHTDVFKEWVVMAAGLFTMTAFAVFVNPLLGAVCGLIAGIGSVYYLIKAMTRYVDEQVAEGV